MSKTPRQLVVGCALLAIAVASVSASAPRAGIPTFGASFNPGEASPAFLQRVRIDNPPLVPNTGMTPPIALVHPAPSYTLEAARAGVEGSVTVRGEFDIEGNFTPIEVVEGLGFGLDEAALVALENWTFRPAYRSGRRVPVVAEVEVEFRRPVIIGGGVIGPRVTSRVSPDYPEEARRARHQGSVILDTIIRRDGTVDVLGVVRELGHGLDEKAMDALGKWTFEPGSRDGEPVDVRLNVQVNFSLR
jgi:TonB family protein